MINLKCCVCGNGAGHFKQHWNRDTGYGICRSCVDWLIKDRKTSPEEILELYGIEGIHYAFSKTHHIKIMNLAEQFLELHSFLDYTDLLTCLEELTGAQKNFYSVYRQEQDYFNETTYWIFDDRSALRFKNGHFNVMEI